MHKYIQSPHKLARMFDSAITVITNFKFWEDILLDIEVYVLFDIDKNLQGLENKAYTSGNFYW